MVIEFSNLDISRGSTPLGGIAFAASTLIFISIPLALIAIGYYSTQPTGSLLSPLPQTVISEETTPTPTIEPEQPIIAADNTSTTSSVVTNQDSNSSDHTISIAAGLTEITIENNIISSNSQILIVPQKDDGSVYFVKSKGDGFFTLGTDKASTQNRAVDYQVVDL